MVMRDKFLPFALPDIGEEEIMEVVDSMRSGWLTTGPKTKAFENAFAAYIGGKVDAMAVSSATAGLHLALEACGIRAGDEEGAHQATPRVRIMARSDSKAAPEVVR